jgi:hypothetical protein
MRDQTVQHAADFPYTCSTGCFCYAATWAPFGGPRRARNVWRDRARNLEEGRWASTGTPWRHMLQIFLLYLAVKSCNEDYITVAYSFLVFPRCILLQKKVILPTNRTESSEFDTTVIEPSSSANPLVPVKSAAVFSRAKHIH